MHLMQRYQMMFVLGAKSRRSNQVQCTARRPLHTLQLVQARISLLTLFQLECIFIGLGQTACFLQVRHQYGQIGQLKRRRTQATLIELLSIFSGTPSIQVGKIITATCRPSSFRLDDTLRLGLLFALPDVAAMLIHH